jgi:alkylation response protein AidB-like acyl-CoA dehydrogenase
MWRYCAPVREMQFVIDEWVGVAKDWQEMPPMEALDTDSVHDILVQAARFAEDILAPSNRLGDQEGCRWSEGCVATPSTFPDIYRQFCEAGWPTIACATEDGGQGLPQLLNAVLYEMCYSANHGWSMYPGLAHGAYECVRTHGSPELKEIYLPRIVSGEWLATMCLSEPQAGTDLGLLTTAASPQEDGSYLISGTKIFISGGEQDMSENIVHLVLARLPGAPSGSRGISLFLIPKRLGVEGRGDINNVYCDGIEHKMGIKGSATCVMRFDGAQGWLLGEPHRGLAAMFVMMNSARLYVGLQGLGHAEAAFQNAARYAAERRQMRLAAPSPESIAVPPGAAVPIFLHASIRRSLMTLKSQVEGQRAMAYWAAHLLDLAEHHPDAERRQESHELVSLLTPVIKAMYTDNGFALAARAQQIFGGYGYLEDYGIEQTVRDSRIALIYEGTNEVQAIDLLVRKVLTDGGAKLQRLLARMSDEASASRESGPQTKLLAERLVALHRELLEACDNVIAGAAADAEYAYRIASDFLQMIGVGLMAAFWCKAARLSESRAATEPYYRTKLASAQFYFDYLVPEMRHRADALLSGKAAVPWLEELPEGWSCRY